MRLSCFEFFKFRVKKVYNMAARGVGLFDSSDDEEEFWRSQEKIFL